MALRGVSKVILVGNLSQDPEVRYMSNGGVGTKITLTTSEACRDKQTSENKEMLEWHRVVLFESALGWRGSTCGKVRRSILRASCARARGWTRAVRVTMPK